MDLDEAPDGTMGCGLYGDLVSICTNNPVSNHICSPVWLLQQGKKSETVEEKKSSFCHLGP